MKKIDRHWCTCKIVEKSRFCNYFQWYTGVNYENDIDGGFTYVH